MRVATETMFPAICAVLYYSAAVLAVDVRR
jgi:hypothetical protein